MNAPLPSSLGSGSLGPFTVLSLLGEGGSGSVYHARFEGREVALKVLRADTTLTEKEVARFVTEAERARRVSHPSLVPVEATGTLPDGRPYIVMPLLRGETLGRVLSRGRIPQTIAIGFFENVAEALIELHGAGLVHRDVKPENVFVTDGRAVLLDLGIAREIGAADSTTTQAGMVRGTPQYMAPERFFGRPAGVTTDVYELGALLYAMLTGRLPWSGADDAQGRMNPMSPARAGVLVPEQLSAALMRALSFSPEARPASVRAFLLEVRGSMRDSQRHLGEASTTLAQHATPSAFGTSTDRTPEPIATQVQPRRGGAGWIAAALAAAAVLAGLGGLGVWKLRSASIRDVVRIEAPPETAAVVSAPPSAIPTSTSSVGPSGSTAPTTSATPSATAAPTTTAPPRPKGGPSASPSAAPTPSAAPSGAPTVSGDPLPSCEKLAAFYCSPQWKPVDRGECAGWTKNARDWRKYTGEARRSLDDSCARTLSTQPGVLAQRLEDVKRGTAPP